MAHELEERDGKASFFQVIREGVSLAWHKLGTYFTAEDRPANTEAALDACRGNFDVEVRPVYFNGYTEDGDTYPVESKRTASIVRTDLNQEVGTASPDYTPMQYREVFRPFDVFIREGLATIETAGVMFNGSRMFMLFRWAKEAMSDTVREAFAGMETYALLTAAHTGAHGVGAYGTNVTVVCRNTEQMAINSALSRFMVKHSKNASTKFVDGVSALWGNVLATNEAAARDMLALRALTLDEAQFRAAVLDVIQPLPQNAPNFDPKARFADAMIKRTEANRDMLSALWINGLGHTGNRSAWEAYTGVTQYIDHGTGLWKPRTLEARAIGLLDGEMARAKVDVFNSLLTLTK